MLPRASRVPLTKRGTPWQRVGRAWVAYLLAADNVSGPLPVRLRRVNQPVISTPTHDGVEGGHECRIILGRTGVHAHDLAPLLRNVASATLCAGATDENSGISPSTNVG